MEQLVLNQDCLARRLFVKSPIAGILGCTDQSSATGDPHMGQVAARGDAADAASPRGIPTGFEDDFAGCWRGFSARM